MGLTIGTGWTIVHSVVTDADNFAATGINFGNRTTTTINTPALNTAAGPMPSLVGDLYEVGTVVMPGYLDTEVDYIPGAATLGLLTITARQLPGETTPATYIGQASLVDETKAVPVEDVVTQELSWKWETDYAFTAATPTP